jgi:hypothetical protein
MVMSSNPECDLALALGLLLADPQELLAFLRASVPLWPEPANKGAIMAA